MNMIKYMDENLLIRKGTEILLKELGPAEALRFICLHPQKRTESVKRHRQWQDKLDKDEFFNAVFGSEY
jgi:hypothetical protein